MPLFDFRHIASLKKLYGYPLIVNLLGRKEGESLLSSAFIDHMNDSEHNKDTSIVSFDYHHHCKGMAHCMVYGL